MNDGDRPHQKQVRVHAVVGTRCRAIDQRLLLDVDRVLAEWYGLALPRQPVADDDRPQADSEDVGPLHVSDSEHETMLTVATADDRVPTEDDRLRSRLRTRQLREYDAGD
jgi:uncharacterized metal-binding protein YceD (DUF177 family)